TPATFGFFHPAVLFPARFLQMEPAMQKAVALHELLHVERHDWLWNMFEEIVLTLLWFHLPLWWVVRSARLSREQVVDAEAVRRSNERRPYLKALLEMAGQKWMAENLPAPLFLRENQLAERVALMIKEVHMSRTRLSVSILTAAVTLLTAGAALVWAFPLKTSATQAESTVTSPAPAENAAGTYQYQGKDHKFLGKIYKVGGDIRAPEPINNPDPPYTPQARKNQVTGTVTFAVVVDAAGNVAEVKQISKPLGQGLDESALRTIRSWKFKPGTRNGVPVPVRVMAKITFRLYGKSSDASPEADPVGDPPAQNNKSDAINTDENHKASINQDEIRRQIEEAMKQAQMAQQVPVKIDQEKLQEQIDQAMKQLKLAEAATPKIDEAKVKEQIDQAMKQIQMSQDLAPKIDQDKLYEQIKKSMEQMEKMNTPEMRQKMQEQMDQLKKLDTPEMRQQFQQQMKQLEKMNTPEMRRQMQEQMEQVKEQIQKMNAPEMRRQFEQAMEQALMAQDSAQKMNKAEIQRQLEQARKEVEQARKEAQDARQEAEKARHEAMKARREAEEQRKAAKPRPSAEPKPVPAPPKEAAPAPPAPPAPPATPASPAPPKTPESAGIVGGVPGGVVGGVPGGIVGGVPGGVVGGVAGGKVTGIQGGQVKGLEGGHVIGVPGGITGGVITARKPPVPPSTSPKEGVATPPASTAPSSPPQN
ncbi:MAG TPA: TonB family protein, partial [Terriglobia bacterium]|nr:TonB family protein [Terriglobia bacterium]